MDGHYPFPNKRWLQSAISLVLAYLEKEEIQRLVGEAGWWGLILSRVERNTVNKLLWPTGLELSR